jgi:restriction system protein
MAKITSQRLGELLQQPFRILQKNPDGLKARIALNELAKVVTLTEHERGHYGDALRFDKIVRFATVDTVRAGWLVKDSGIWTVTADGIAALKSWPDPLEFYRQASWLYRQWRKKSKADADKQNGLVEAIVEKEDASEVEERDTSVTFEQAKDQARTDIEEYLEAMHPYDFQNLVGDLLRAMGYFVEWIAPPGSDGGVDIIAHTDPLGTQGPRIKVQVKRQQETASKSDLQKFVANIGQHDSGIFVCTGGFKKTAAEYARGLETRRLTLIDVDRLVKLWIEFTPKLPDRARKLLPLEPIYFLKLQG